MSCSKTEAELGSEKNPIKMYFVPSMEAAKVVTSGKVIADKLHDLTGLYIKVVVPLSYAAVIEALGTGECDVAWLPTFAYVMAHEKYKADVELMTVRKGLQRYRGQFIARADSDIKKIEDIAGKTIAYTDVASTSGYIYPSAILKQKGIETGKEIFAGGHPQAVLAVYNGNVDVGCTYWSPIDKTGIPQDARKSVMETYPDVMKKVVPVGFTEWIPNDTVTFRENFDDAMKQNLVTGMLKLVETEEGKNIMDELYSIDGLVKAKNSDYDVVRKTLETLGKSASDFVNK
eukprot:Anaeramoba_ignava/a352756_5.p1 GENE.a352756_5~~a352756_5.p1  ORF type:complete len:288 (-),score=22.27 a352756_5:94-957(-)